MQPQWSLGLQQERKEMISPRKKALQEDEELCKVKTSGRRRL